MTDLTTIITAIAAKYGPASVDLAIYSQHMILPIAICIAALKARFV